MFRGLAIALVGIIIGSLLLSGSDSRAQSPTTPPAAAADGQNPTALLRRMLESQIQAKQDENLVALFANADRTVALRQQARFRKIFEAYDLLYSLDDFKLLYSDEGIAIARFRQTVRKTSGPTFKDNQKDALQVFVKREGKWRIFEQVIIDRTDLEAAKSPDPDPPAGQPSEKPTTQPTAEPTTQPTADPAAQPTGKPDTPPN